MTTCRCMWVVAGVLALMVPTCGAQGPKMRKEAVSGVKSEETRASATDDLAAKISFRFDILDLATDHQFAGQKNSFHVEYEYAGVLKGAEFDPKGHAVGAATYPYFQSVRDTILDTIAKYPDKNDFYEVFGMNICERVIRAFPQIQKITLRIDAPAYGPVNVDRGETIVVERRAARK